MSTKQGVGWPISVTLMTKPPHRPGTTCLSVLSLGLRGMAGSLGPMAQGRGLQNVSRRSPAWACDSGLLKASLLQVMLPPACLRTSTPKSAAAGAFLPPILQRPLSSVAAGRGPYSQYTVVRML